MAGHNIGVGQLSGTGVVDNLTTATSATLTVGNGNASSTFAGSVLSSVGSVGVTKTGSGTLTLTGNNSQTGGLLVNAGTVVVQSAQSYTGGTTVAAGGTLRLALTPVAGYSRWFDASNPGNLTVSGGQVTQMNDLSGNGKNATAVTAGGGASGGNPTYTSNAVNGLGAVTFSGRQAVTFAEDANIKSTFSVFKGASFLMTDTGSYNFHRNESGGTDNDPTSSMWGSDASPNILTGSTYINGVLKTNASIINTLNSTPASPATNGFNLVEVLLTNGGTVAANGFNDDRNFTHFATTSQSQAEVLIYDTVLTTAQRLQNEAYLNYKWFGIGTGVNNFLPSATAVNLAGAGATLDLGGSQQTIGSLTASDSTAQVTLGNAGVLTTGNDNSNSTFAGVISGAGSLSKIGSGSFTLSGANTFTGTTTVTGGSLVLANTLALQSSTLVTGGVAFDSSVVSHAFTLGGLSGSANITLADNAGAPNAVALTIGANGSSSTYSGALSGGGSLTKAGSGTLTLTGTNTFTGPLAINGGVLNFASSANLGNGSAINFGGGTLQYATGNTFDISTRTVTLNAGGGAIDTNGNSFTLVGSLGGAGGFTKAGTGTLTLTATNAYSGITVVSAGTLQIGNGTTDGSISSSSGITDNASLVYNLIGNQTNNNVISGSGSLTKTGAGTLTLGGVNTFAGNTSVTGGALTIASAGALNGTSSVNESAGGVLNISGTVTVANNGVFAVGSGVAGAGGTVNVNAGAVLNLGNGSGTTHGRVYIGGQLDGNGTAASARSISTAALSTSLRVEPARAATPTTSG